jgi:hypothetical protein
MSAKDDASGATSRAELEESVGALQQVAKAQASAARLKDKAAHATSPAQQKRLFEEAHELEAKANGYSKIARRMQSGTWQGLFGGGGIGAGVGLGLGAVLGTLLGGLLSIPTIALGSIVGSGVGAVHGPWIKVGGKDTWWEDATPSEIVDALEQDHGSIEQSGTQGASAKQEVVEHASSAAPQKKKPRKLEIRSVRCTADAQHPVESMAG